MLAARALLVALLPARAAYLGSFGGSGGVAGDAAGADASCCAVGHAGGSFAARKQFLTKGEKETENRSSLASSIAPSLRLEFLPL